MRPLGDTSRRGGFRLGASAFNRFIAFMIRYTANLRLAFRRQSVFHPPRLRSAIFGARLDEPQRPNRSPARVFYFCLFNF